MATYDTTLSSSSETCVMKKLVRDKFALLARVGVRKREASAFQDEAEFYCGIVTGLLAASAEQLLLLQMVADETNVPRLKGAVADITSRQHRLIKQLLDFWPRNTESQTRTLNLLGCAGLVKMTERTDDGSVSLSTDQILKNVARAIAATKVPTPSPSSSSGMTTQLVCVGTAGAEQATV